MTLKEEVDLRSRLASTLANAARVVDETDLAGGSIAFLWLVMC